MRFEAGGQYDGRRVYISTIGFWLGGLQRRGFPVQG